MMAIPATLPGLNLFSNLPTTPPPQNGPNTTPPPPPIPIPIPKYPPPLRIQKSQDHPKSFKNPEPDPRTFSNDPAFKTHHPNSKDFKPGQVLTPKNTKTTTSASGDGGSRCVIVGESGASYRLLGAPFEFAFSYSEIPKAKPLALREPDFLPFAPPSTPRPWTGKALLKKKKTRKIKLFEAHNDEECDNQEKNLKYYEMLKNYELGKYEMRPREEVLGESLSRIEIKELLKPLLSCNKQVNLGRDGLTHNMLELIHSHWRRGPVCKVRCFGVPTVDMDNICRCLEEKTNGEVVHRVGGVVYIFRGRNYDHWNRPKLPVMLWKPAAPVYPKLIQEAPEGLTRDEADELRIKGKNLLPICKLAKNGVYVTLVGDVRIAFEGCPLVKIDCKGMHASDYKKLGAKLKELVPCVLLSFDDEQILMWRGKDWKPKFTTISPTIKPGNSAKADDFKRSGDPSVNFGERGEKKVSSIPRMMYLWQHAVDSGKALLLDEIKLAPDDLLAQVEQFESKSQATELPYTALISSSKDGSGFSRTQTANYDSEDDDYCENATYADDHSALEYINDSFEVESSLPLGSLPVDFVAEELRDE